MVKRAIATSSRLRNKIPKSPLTYTYTHKYMYFLLCVTLTVIFCCVLVVVEKADMADPSSFPKGLKVLVVDDDKTTLRMLEKMLQFCNYQVTTCERGEDALALLQEDKSKFDIILCDLHMPQTDGLKVLQVIRSQSDVPVVMMSSDDSSEAVMKGVINGANDFLVKPITMEQVRVMWQHVVRRRQNNKLKGNVLGARGDLVVNHSNYADNNNVSATSAENLNLMRRGNGDEDEEGEEEEGDASHEYEPRPKKPRIIWTPELHQKFIEAVHQLGREKAVPKKILECMQQMGVTDLTRENVASHLQKFRLYVRRRNGESLEHSGNSSSFLAANGFDTSSSSGVCALQPTFSQFQYGNNIAMALHEQRKFLDPMMTQSRQAHLPALLGQPAGQMAPPRTVNFQNATFGNHSLLESDNNFGVGGQVNVANVGVPHPMNMFPQNKELENMIPRDHVQQHNTFTIDDATMMTDHTFVPNGALYAPFLKEGIGASGAGGVLPGLDTDPETRLYVYDQDNPFFNQS